MPWESSGKALLFLENHYVFSHLPFRVASDCFSLGWCTSALLGRHSIRYHFLWRTHGWGGHVFTQMPLFQYLLDASRRTFADPISCLDGRVKFVFISDVLLIELVFVIFFDPSLFLFIFLDFTLVKQLLSLQVILFLFLQLNNDLFTRFQQFKVCLVCGFRNVDTVIIF